MAEDLKRKDLIGMQDVLFLILNMVSVLTSISCLVAFILMRYARNACSFWSHPSATPTLLILGTWCSVFLETHFQLPLNKSAPSNPKVRSRKRQAS